MTTFIGYNTQGQERDFTLTDYELIVRDLLNAFNIRQGELPGRPSVGSALLDMVFENQSPEVEAAIQNEIRRIIKLDPRLALKKLLVYPNENGILVQIEIDTVTGVSNAQLNILFDQRQQRAIAV